jgi:hypothetical protein
VIQHSDTDRVVIALQRTLSSRDPLAALQSLTELREELTTFERHQAKKALDTGSSFGSIGRALGISRQAAHRRYRDQPETTAQPQRAVVSDQVRALLSAARSEAARAGAHEIECEHLALALAATNQIKAAQTNLEAARVLVAQGGTAPPPTKLGKRLRTLLIGRPIDVQTLLEVLPQDAPARRVLERLSR